VQKKALGFVKSWAEQFEGTRDPNLGIMGELYDQLRAKSELISAGWTRGIGHD
jgi:signal transducing adaptor molecule